MVLQVGGTLTSEEIIPLLASYKLIPQLLCEMIIDRAIAPINCTPEEKEWTCQQFYQHFGDTSYDLNMTFQSTIA